jgi:hypothetical protein
MKDTVSISFHGMDLEFGIDYDIEPRERGDLYCPPSEGGIVVNTARLLGAQEMEVKDPSDELLLALEDAISDRLSDGD